MTSVLTLTNNMAQDSTVELTIYNLAGVPLRVAPVVLKPQSVRQLRIADLTAGSSGFSAGNMRLGYVGPWRAVTAQVTVVSSQRRVSFESNAVLPNDFASSRLAGIVWIPDEETEARLALTNTTSAALKVAAVIRQRTKSVLLGAHQTRLVNLKEWVERNTSAGTLVTLTHDGQPGALIATGFLTNSATGFSSNLFLVDPAAGKSSQLSGAHFRFGIPNPAEGFPVGTQFRGILALGDAGSSTTTGQVFVDYTSGGDSLRVQPGSFTLEPGAVTTMSLSDELARLGISGPVSDAGVDIVYTGTPGSVIGNLTSFDQSGDFSFDVPLKDPLLKGSAGGTNPWTVENGTKSVLHLKNTTDKETSALVQIRFEGGVYNVGRRFLKPYQTVGISINQIRTSGKTDLVGNKFPLAITHGQIVWYERHPGSLIGRTEQTNIQGGVASSFSCGNPCDCPPNFQSASMDPASFTTPAGTQGAFFSPVEWDIDCNGILVQGFPYIAGWGSSNTAAATGRCFRHGDGEPPRDSQYYGHTQRRELHRPGFRGPQRSLSRERFHSGCHRCLDRQPANRHPVS